MLRLAGGADAPGVGRSSSRGLCRVLTLPKSHLRSLVRVSRDSGVTGCWWPSGGLRVHRVVLLSCCGGVVRWRWRIFAVGRESAKGPWCFSLSVPL